MTPDDMLEHIILASGNYASKVGARTLWLAASRGNLQDDGQDPGRVLSATPAIPEETFRQGYVELMARQHRGHLLAGTERSARTEGKEVLLIDVVSSNRRHPWEVDLVDGLPTGKARRAKEGVFQDEDVRRYQAILRRNAMLNEGVA